MSASLDTLLFRSEGTGSEGDEAHRVLIENFQDKGTIAYVFILESCHPVHLIQSNHVPELKISAIPPKPSQTTGNAHESSSE